jgi:hypothetical protein
MELQWTRPRFHEEHLAAVGVRRGLDQFVAPWLFDAPNFGSPALESRELRWRLVHLIPSSHDDLDVRVRAELEADLFPILGGTKTDGVGLGVSV